MTQLQSDYDLLSSLASTAEAGGLAKERSVLLLWFLRNVVGLDDLDAYEFVCDGDLDGGVDAALAGHFAGAVPVPVLEAGSPGLDAPGDSLLRFPGGSADGVVSASAGTTLYYLCALHPWMQGSISVG